MTDLIMDTHGSERYTLIQKDSKYTDFFFYRSAVYKLPLLKYLPIFPVAQSDSSLNVLIYIAILLIWVIKAYRKHNTSQKTGQGCTHL